MLLIGAYRDNEVGPGHPLHGELSRIMESASATTEINLGEIDADTIIELVCDTISPSPRDATWLAQLLYRRTGGNPFFVAQILRRLFDDGVIVPDQSDANHVVLDYARIESVAVTDDVVDFLAGRLRQLSKSTQQALRFAACIGTVFSIDTVSRAMGCKAAETAKLMWPALQAGLILPLDDGYKLYFDGAIADYLLRDDFCVHYRFLHDRVQHAAYELIELEQRPETHFRLASLAWEGDFAENEDVYSRLRILNVESDNSLSCFEIAGHLNRSRRLFLARDDANHWKRRAKQVNLIAGNKAAASSAYDAAFRYFSTGLLDTSVSDWQTDYELAHSLHYNAAESAFLTNRMEDAEALQRATLKRCQVEDRIKVIRLQVTQFQLQGRNGDALRVIRAFFAERDCALPLRELDVRAAIDAEVLLVRQYVAENGVDSVLDLPSNHDIQLIEMQKLLQVLFYAAWRNGEPSLAFLALCRLTNSSLDRGNSEMAPFSYVGFGLVGVGYLRDYVSAYEFGRVAIELSERLGDSDARGMTHYIFASDVAGWSQPLRENQAAFECAHRFGMAADNLLTVGFMLQQSATDRLVFGDPLEALIEQAEANARYLEKIGNIDNMHALRVGVIAPARNLRDGSKTPEEPCKLSYLGFDEDDFLVEYSDKPYYLAAFYASKIRLAVYWYDTKSFLEMLEHGALVLEKVPSHANKIPATVFHTALMQLYLARTHDDKEAKVHLQGADALIDRLQIWAKACPQNVEHKLMLVRAERARTIFDKERALDLYDQAIACADQSGYINEKALACELAARFLHDWNKPALCVPYLEAALHGYEQLGAAAKVSAIEREMVAVRAHCTLGGTPGVDRAESAVTPTRIAANDGPRPTSEQKSFDAISLLELADSFAGLVEPGDLYAKIAQILAENTGAETCALLEFLPDRQQGSWDLKALYGPNTGQLDQRDEEPLVLDSALIPVAFIEHASSQPDITFWDDGEQPQSGSHIDPYLVSRRPKSVVAIPIRSQGRLLGVAYLENQLTRGVFFGARSEVAKFICSQAGIALRTADLYQRLMKHSNDLEREVEQRTEQLAKANEKLSKLAETDPLTGLGNRRYFDEKLSEVWRECSSG